MTLGSLEDIIKCISRRPARWPAVMDRATASEYCGLSVSGFDQWVRERRLPGPLPKTKRWSRAAIDRYIDKMDEGNGFSREDDEALLLVRWMEKNGV